MVAKNRKIVNTAPSLSVTFSPDGIGLSFGIAKYIMIAGTKQFTAEGIKILKKPKKGPCGITGNWYQKCFFKPTML